MSDSANPATLRTDADVPPTLPRFGGKLHICSPRSTGGSRPWVLLTLTDPVSRTRVLEIEVPMEQFAEALLRQQEVGCDIIPMRPGLLGKEVRQRDVTVEIPAGMDYAHALEALQQKGAEALKQGLVLDTYEAKQLLRQKLDSFQVRASFYVDPGTGEIVDPLTGALLDPQPE